MIDWPNALVGFVLGVAATLVFWFIDRARARRERRAEVWDAWKSAAKEIELMLGRPTTTAGSLYLARVKYPVDTWRAILGPDSFRQLEDLQRSYGALEYWARTLSENPADPELQAKFDSAMQERKEAMIAFANFSRQAQSDGYQAVIRAEARRDLRRDYLRKPISTWKRQRHNKRMRQREKR